MNNNLQQKKILIQVLRYVKKYRLALILSLAMGVLSVAGTLAIPMLVGRAVDCIVSPGHVDFAGAARELGWVLVWGILSAGAQWAMSEMNNRITFRVTRDIRTQAFEKLQTLPLSYLDSHPQGKTVSHVIADVDTFADGLLMGFSQLLTGALTIGGTLLIMLRMSWKIALVVLCVTPVSLLAARFIAGRTFSMFQLQTRIRAGQTALVDEMLGQIKTVRAFGREKQVLERFGKINDDLERCSRRATFFSSITNPTTRFINTLVYTGVGLTGALSALSGGISVGVLTGFLSYANQYTKPFNEISGVIAQLQNAIACAGQVFELIGEKSEIPDPPGSPGPRQIQGSVSIRDMCFSYDPRRPLIEDFSLAAEAGSHIAIVGPTGCGKTTFINLLMRFYDPDGGEILLDGINTRSMSRRTLRRSVGMVLQDTWLAAGTIRDNIALGRPEATDGEIEAAARAAHAHGFISRLPEGYQTRIGEAGGNLSQGQKQLLCIARVMLCLPPMLFLDEATSSIDTRTEAKIQKAFDTMMQGRTTFIVAHRLSTIEQADRILVMRDGKIVEQGTHRQLLEQKGFYARLYESQFAH